MLGEFGGERIGVGYGDKGVQPQVAMPRVVRHRRDVSFGFDEDLRSVAANDGEERVLLGLLKPCLKTELVAVEGDGSFDVADDEGWRDGV